MKTFLKPLTAGEEREYLKLCNEGDEEAKSVLIERNLRLVAHVIKKYQYTDYDMEDLLSVGTIGLIKAVNTFKVDRGSRLATYAAKCVENAILSQWHQKQARQITSMLKRPKRYVMMGETGALRENSSIFFLPVILSA